MKQCIIMGHVCLYQDPHFVAFVEITRAQATAIVILTAAFLQGIALVQWTNRIPLTEVLLQSHHTKHPLELLLCLRLDFSAYNMYIKLTVAISRHVYKKICISHISLK